ncbi:interleukin-1 receptor type 2 [Clinocottus analis]|uniref:interleukin-1 receptor type 2 n=1 Tax=Clinocottus analis TaxID=304258 RepID=UPI0035BF2A0B
MLLLLLFIQTVYGGPTPPEGCHRALPEPSVLRVAGEAVILSFTMLESELQGRGLPAAKCLIARDDGAVEAVEGGAYRGEGRVRQRDNQLWLLPAQAADSGNYTCTYRNGSSCVSGSIRLRVFESRSARLQLLAYQIPLLVGERLRLRCPSLSGFNDTERLTQWTRGPAPDHAPDHAPGPPAAGSVLQAGGRLLIPAVRRAHAGVYTCRLRAHIGEQQYRVSRTVVLRVDGDDPVTTTSDPEVTSSSFSTINIPVIQPPVIVSPRDGDVLESPHGSGLELSCTVRAECQEVDHTLVTWLVNNQSMESWYLDGRGLQGGRRVIRVSGVCLVDLSLVFVSLTDEDEQTELRCVAQNRGGRQEVVVRLQLEDSSSTWLLVGAVAASCFLAVVSIFLFLLFKPRGKKNSDYFLTRQSSSY